MYQNTKRQIIAPIVLALTFICGFVANMMFQTGEKSIPIFVQPQVDKLTAVLNAVQANYVDAITKEELIELALPIILEQLDPHSVYFPATDYDEISANLEGNFEGIGVQFVVQNDTIYILRIIPEGPSEEAGLLAGDRIIKINDSIVAGKGIINDGVIDLLKGEAGSKVVVEVQRRGTEGLTAYEIERAVIPIFSVAVSYEVTDEIGYIKIERFARNTYEEFQKAVEDLHNKGIHKLIIDLRSNGGGFLEIASGIADDFLENEKLIVYTEGNARARENYYASEHGTCEDDEVVVLIDSWSASASEILAGALQDNDRGVVVGQRSFGKGLVQETTAFRDGSAFRLTIARYYTPTGRSIQKPYSNTEEYEKEIMTRYEHAEMLETDSIVFNDSLKFTTPKGRFVYGGGGIMPDVFVPYDTTGWTGYFTELTEKNIIYDFSLIYADYNREVLSEMADYKELVAYLEQKNVLAHLIDYAERQGVKKVPKDFIISKKYIVTQLHAYIARNVFDDAGFYPIIHNIDDTFLKAVDILKTNAIDSILNTPGKL